MENVSPTPKSYCQFVRDLEADNLHKIYHDRTYGFPLEDDNELFGRLILEINQAGLSWFTILKKQENFRKAYANFEIEKVANFTEKDRERLLQDAGIIRNKLKVNATIHNAQKIMELKKEFDSFKNWLDNNHPKTREEWTKLFKKHFKFVGGEIVNEFLVSTAYLPNAHEKDCPIYQKILELDPPFLR